MALVYITLTPCKLWSHNWEHDPVPLVCYTLGTQVWNMVKDIAHKYTSVYLSYKGLHSDFCWVIAFLNDVNIISSSS